MFMATQVYMHLPSLVSAWQHIPLLKVNAVLSSVLVSDSSHANCTPQAVPKFINIIIITIFITVPKVVHNAY